MINFENIKKLLENSVLDGQSGIDQNDTLWTPPGESKKLRPQQLHGCVQIEFPKADDVYGTGRGIKQPEDAELKKATYKFVPSKTIMTKDNNQPITSDTTLTAKETTKAIKRDIKAPELKKENIIHQAIRKYLFELDNNEDDLIAKITKKFSVNRQQVGIEFTLGKEVEKEFNENESEIINSVYKHLNVNPRYYSKMVSSGIANNENIIALYRKLFTYQNRIPAQKNTLDEGRNEPIQSQINKFPEVSLDTLKNTSNSMRNYIVICGDKYMRSQMLVHVGFESNNHLDTVKKFVKEPIIKVLLDNRKKK